MAQENYYEPLSQDVFKELKEACIKEWKKHDNTYGYVDEKVDRIKNLENISDNGLYMLAMFDSSGQASIKNTLGQKALEEINERIN